jgi:hypothetical protein
VLRLLFAKVNSVQGFVDSVPSHTFDDSEQFYQEQQGASPDLQ